MFPINQFKIELVSQSDEDGVFNIGPLPTGYAHTLGTVLRRILLSSIPGAAVTAVNVEGVPHEYTSITGLKDDVLSVVLATKEISVKSHSDEPVELKLSKKGKKGEVTVVTAADFEKNPMVEIVNPDLEITTLADEKASLNMTIIVEKGIGYRLPDQNKRNEVGLIPIDATFSPVKLVSVAAKNTRVGQQTDLDMLEITIKTDKTVLPQIAVHQAAEILNTMSAHMVDQTSGLLSAKIADQAKKSDLPIAEVVVEKVTKVEPILVSDLNLSTRLTNALVNGGYEDLNTLEGLTEEEVRTIKGMGEKSFTELLDVLDEKGIKLI